MALADLRNGSVAKVERRIIPEPGVRLVADCGGAANGAPTLLFLHGRGQTRQEWAAEPWKNGQERLSGAVARPQGSWRQRLGPDGKYLSRVRCRYTAGDFTYLGGRRCGGASLGGT